MNEKREITEPISPEEAQQASEQWDQMVRRERNEMLAAIRRRPQAEGPEEES